jgi:hypothetical protein
MWKQTSDGQRELLLKLAMQLLTNMSVKWSSIFVVNVGFTNFDGLRICLKSTFGLSECVFMRADVAVAAGGDIRKFAVALAPVVAQDLEVLEDNSWARTENNEVR